MHKERRDGQHTLDLLRGANKTHRIAQSHAFGATCQLPEVCRRYDQQLESIEGGTVALRERHHRIQQRIDALERWIVGNEQTHAIGITQAKQCAEIRHNARRNRLSETFNVDAVEDHPDTIVGKMQMTLALTTDVFTDAEKDASAVASELSLHIAEVSLFAIGAEDATNGCRQARATGDVARDDFIDQAAAGLIDIGVDNGRDGVHHIKGVRLHKRRRFGHHRRRGQSTRCSG